MPCRSSRLYRLDVSISRATERLRLRRAGIRVGKGSDGKSQEKYGNPYGQRRVVSVFLSAFPLMDAASGYFEGCNFRIPLVGLRCYSGILGDIRLPGLFATNRQQVFMAVGCLI